MNIAIDFEYVFPSEPGMGLVSCALSPENGPTETFWLWNNAEGPRALLARLQALKDATFLGYNNQLAEARCFAALGLNPHAFKWRDLMLEWLWLRNGDNRYQYGRTVKNGFHVETFAPAVRVGKKASLEEEAEAKEENDAYLEDLQAELDEGTRVSLEPAGLSLLDCCYFFECLGLQGYRDAEAVKKRVRDGILVEGAKEDIEANRDVIIAYNGDDVKDMHKLAAALTREMNKVGKEEHMQMFRGEIKYRTFTPEDVSKIQLNLGDWAARLATYAHRGIPLSRKRLDRLLEIVPVLQEQERTSWNREHPDTPLYRVGFSGKVLAEKKGPLERSPYVKNLVSRDGDMLAAIIGRYCKDSGFAAWPKTKTGMYDTSKKVIDRYAAGENLIKLLQRHNNALSALKTYSKNKDGEVEALRYIGSDNRQRPDFGPYGTQTARNAAKAKSLCFLGPHWLRMLVEPPKGKVIVEVDAAAQEVFIAGALSNDANLLRTYAANDVYMYFAQLVGMYPADLPIPTEEQRAEAWFKPYKLTRNISKTLFLSQQFGAGFRAVAAAVRDATKNPDITDDQGKEWVDDYKSAYCDYVSLADELKHEYGHKTSIFLASGWRMGPDNPSALSAGNVPVQGAGSDILREACKIIDAQGPYIIATLHDAITAICDEGEEEKVAKLIHDAFVEASEKVLGKNGLKVGAPEFVRHGHVWVHSEKAKAAWEKLASYFEGL